MCSYNFIVAQSCYVIEVPFKVWINTELEMGVGECNQGNCVNTLDMPSLLQLSCNALSTPLMYESEFTLLLQYDLIIIPLLGLVWKPHLFHSTGCIASPARGRVWSTCHTVFVSLPKNHGEHTYFVCTSYGVRLNFVIASRLIKRYPAMPANVAHSLFIHSRDTKTVWHVDQTLPRAGDAIHPVLWKRCGFQTILGHL